MAVKLRLRRMGKKKQPIYKLVAADSRAPRDGKFLEAIGLYNPLTDPATIDIKEDRALYWLGVGAQPTETVKNLLSKKGILLKRELSRKGLSEADQNSKFEAWSKLNEAKAGSGKKQTKAGAKEGTASVKEQPKEVTEVKSTTSDENPA
ncbi:MAG TPA: 30S ribosomal protein S16 [Ignavibacteriales bacterium]|nr:30S ribosomal protein S16 [Ignavibacteriales bacterium]